MGNNYKYFASIYPLLIFKNAGKSYLLLKCQIGMDSPLNIISRYDTRWQNYTILLSKDILRNLKQPSRGRYLWGENVLHYKHI